VIALVTTKGETSLAQAAHDPSAPVTTDPAIIDTAYPPSTAELAFPSHGSRLNGFMYLAQGNGPHPTIVLLHGFPGNERNLDLAQAFRRAGMNVLFFSYRGAWGSGGTFSFANALEDVRSAIEYVRADSSVAAFRSDPAQVILIGHSMGGWLTLMQAAADSSIECAAVLDFWNVGHDGQRMQRERAVDSSETAYNTWVTAPGGPIHADGKALSAEMKRHAETWDPIRLAPGLARHSLLIISTNANDSHKKLVAALRAAGAPRVTALQWKTDHSFSDRRIHLARTMVDWLRERCSR
jgi:dipeptidyl aminopeptidase/acylaminoacyl peptidase